MAVNCHHNYVAREHHFGADVYVTRKGAVLAGAGLAAKMVDIAEGWTEVGERLKKISEGDDAAGLPRVADLVLRQSDREEAFWREVASLV